MSGSVNYGLYVDRESGTFDISIDYYVPGYDDPETGESFYETNWSFYFYDHNSGSGGGGGGYGWDSGWAPLSIGFPGGDQIMDATLDFYAQNWFSGENVSMQWHILNAGLATQGVTLTGLATADIILSGYGDDSLSGLGGDDYLDGGDGDDVIDGGEGNDEIWGGGGADAMTGGGGHDRYYVDSVDDIVVEAEGGGNDIVFSSVSYTLADHVESLSLAWPGLLNGTGNAGANNLYGNESTNILRGLGGDDSLFGYGGDDRLLGGDGDDYLDGGFGDDRMAGGIGNDSYVIDCIADRVFEEAGEGVDEARVLAAAYRLGDHVENLTNVGDAATFRGVGNSLANVITGSWQRDILLGMAGADVLAGGDGNDVLQGGADGDLLQGGDGFDVASYAHATSGVTANLHRGRGMAGEAMGDRFESIEGLAGSDHGDLLLGDIGNNRLLGGGGDDDLRGGGGNDWLNGGAGADRLDGGLGQNGVSYVGSATGVAIDLASQTASGGDADGDILANFVHAEGSDGNDVIVGDGRANLLSGRGGDDRLEGGGGADILRGGAGADMLIGGAGMDSADYGTSSAGVTINLADGTALGGDATGDSFESIERVIGSAHGDSITGDDNANMLSGGDGDDLLTGGGGNDVIRGGFGVDTMDGGEGRDTISYQGSTNWVSVFLYAGVAYGSEGAGDSLIGFENIRGSEMGDALYGDGGNNRIEGGGGGDYIVGGAGRDVLVGGDGDDAFLMTTDSGVDTIVDFLPGGGWEDRIHVDMGGAFADFDSIMAVATQVGDDTVIDFSGGNILILAGVDRSALTAQDFVM